ncbi:MAG TPA: GNAT family N-acetyltransferase [Bacteroidales bacterium]|nr:GNAT family N-acetyltransferase [Bacteroidales bacterium]
MNQQSDFRIKDGFDQMDFDKVQAMLEKVFWSIGIKKEEIIQGAKNSALLVGVFNSGGQIGFARVISDKTRFAYIMDVVVDKNYRKQGIGQLMIRYILNHPDLNDVYQWLLKTKDAHGVYEKVGFRLIPDPERWMGIMHERPER